MKPQAPLELTSALLPPCRQTAVQPPAQRTVPQGQEAIPGIPPPWCETALPGRIPASKPLYRGKAPPPPVESTLDSVPARSTRAGRAAPTTSPASCDAAASASGFATACGRARQAVASSRIWTVTLLPRRPTRPISTTSMKKSPTFGTVPQRCRRPRPTPAQHHHFAGAPQLPALASAPGPRILGLSGMTVPGRAMSPAVAVPERASPGPEAVPQEPVEQKGRLLWTGRSLAMEPPGRLTGPAKRAMVMQPACGGTVPQLLAGVSAGSGGKPAGLPPPAL